MKVKRGLTAWVAGALAWGVLFGATGCDDEDDGSSGNQETVVTNGANGTPVAATNGEPASVPPADMERAAPQLLSPTDQAEYFVLLFNGKTKVVFEWAPLPGVGEYDLRLAHLAGGYRFSGTTGAVEFPVGTYTWWIEGMYPIGEQFVEAGPASVKRTFTVRQQNVGILPP